MAPCRTSWACAVAGVAVGWIAGCKSLDHSLLDVPDTGILVDAGKDASPIDGRVPEVDAGHDAGSDASVCKKKTESCNGKDDDCDDKVDEQGDEWCEANVIFHATAVCEPMGDTAVCFKFGKCDVGYQDCDGQPANGCEPYCNCNVCDDGGLDDAGP